MTNILCLKNGSETHQKCGEQKGPVKVPSHTQKNDISRDTRKGTVKPSGGIKEDKR